MSESEKVDAQSTENSGSVDPTGKRPDAADEARKNKQLRQKARRWWIKLIVPPCLLLVCGAILILGLGVAQRFGFLSGGGGIPSTDSSTDETTWYICPMLCTPPLSAPGRCPVCAMELVPAAPGVGKKPSRFIDFDPVARRIANIQTVSVESAPITRTIRTIGEIRYDEGTLKTLSAYVDGRLDRLYADYTGVVVKKGDRLALVYSPRLYSAQVEFLLARKALEESRSATLPRVIQSNRDLYESAEQRLIELGMTTEQIEGLKKSGEANNRMHLYAPSSGTVIEKLAEEGQYVKEGQAIYKMANLSTVWLMLELFPEDAAAIRYGQKVTASVQSLPGKNFSGRVAFVDPNVNPKTRTVGVRVVIPNPEGVLRVGDYAKAVINVPLTGSRDEQSKIYDPELAKKWISPRHPQVVESKPGKCRICGVDLVPAARFGFTEQPVAGGEGLIVPRDAVLMAGGASVLYVETKPGRFEIRPVVLGPVSGDRIVILSGVKKGEQVATRGNFLIDSQMQLARNPSLIDPTKADRMREEIITDEIRDALSKLSKEDQSIVESQRICPVSNERLGSMGTPQKVDVNGTAIFVCCEGCRKKLLGDPAKYTTKLPAHAKDKQSHDNGRQLDEPSGDVPKPIHDPEIVEPQSDLPPNETPQEFDDGATKIPQTPNDSRNRAVAQNREFVR